MVYKNECLYHDFHREQENFLSEPADESQKTYWYHKDWRDYVVDSNLFYIRPGHHNPTSMPLFSETHIAENVKIGWLFLGKIIACKDTFASALLN